mmetsp:Transcript_7294/g.26485  ORF Transcript_7294/g.26485 Transcript_7294/m.26485 type:complete len:245 (-) Transcript_7294:1167-1901(-)
MAPKMQAPSVKGKPFEKKSRMRRARDKSVDLASTTTFGGVAVGSMNAKEVAMVAGNKRAKGLITASVAADPKMGSIAAAVPMLENTCAQSVTHTRIKKSKMQPSTWGMALAMPSPRTIFSPEFVKPELMAMPPPIRSNRPKSNFSCTTGHVRSAWPGRTTEGTKKSRSAGRHAIVASLTMFSPLGVVTKGEIANGRRISIAIWSTWIAPAMASSREKGPTSRNRSSYSLSSTSRSMPRNFRPRT